VASQGDTIDKRRPRRIGERRLNLSEPPFSFEFQSRPVVFESEIVGETIDCFADVFVIKVSQNGQKHAFHGGPLYCNFTHIVLPFPVSLTQWAEFCVLEQASSFKRIEDLAQAVSEVLTRFASRADAAIVIDRQSRPVNPGHV
jgi:hypothetical protein